MLKKLMVTAAVTGLTVGAAVAQGNMSQSPASTPTPPPAAKTTDTTKPAAGSSAQFINSQKPDQYLASKFKGTDVVGSDNQKIGDVSDILFDKDGKIEAYVVGVGGFLGLGTKDVALAPSAFTVVAGDKSKNESDKLKLSMTKDQLKQAANFQPYKAPSSTTGSGTMGSRPIGGLGGASHPAPR